MFAPGSPSPEVGRRSVPHLAKERERRFAWAPLALVLVLALVAALHLRALDYRCDDAAINFRYVQNLLSGRGLVYNAGERVEGYSNLSWVLLLAAGAWLSGDVAASARVMNVLLSAACVLLTYSLATRSGLPRWRALLAPLLLSLSTPFAIWAGSGLESALFAALISAAVLEQLRASSRPLVAGAWLGWLAITRPEGALFTVVAAGYELWQRRLRGALRLALPALLLLALQVGFRRVYYRQWLPNTYFAKVDFSWAVAERGLGYLSHYAVHGTWLPVVVLLLGCLESVRRPKLRLMVLCLLAYLVWIVSVGGDGLFSFRFVAHVLPLGCVLAAHGTWGFCDRLALLAAGTPLYRVALPVLLALCQCFPSALLLLKPQWTWFEDNNGIRFPDPRYGWLVFDHYFVERVKRGGRYINDHAKATDLIAAEPAGIAFYVRQPVLDLLGLNDLVIARTRSSGARVGRAGHERSDAAYVLSRRPAYILLDNVAVLPMPLDEAGVKEHLYMTAERDLWQSPEFHRDYERVVVELEPSGPFRYFTYYRRRARK